MAGGCGVGAFCSFCGKCGRVFATTVSGVEVPHVAPPGVVESADGESAVMSDSTSSVVGEKNTEGGRQSAERFRA